MELNTSTSLVTAVISACIGFGLAFYIERKISASMQKKSQKTLVAIAMISFGYGLMATLNEVVGFPMQGLNIRYDKLVAYVLVNILILPIIFIAIAKLIASSKPANLVVSVESNSVASGRSKYFLILVGALSVALLAYLALDNISNQSVDTYDFYSRTDYKNCNSPYESTPFSIQFTLKKDENKIFVTSEYFHNGVRKKEIQSLDKCDILDAKNWSCGGEWMGNYYTDKYTLVKGELYYDQMSPLLDGDPICPPKIVKR